MDDHRPAGPLRPVLRLRSEQPWRAWSRTAAPVQCERNFVIFEEGDDADELFVVASGRVAIGRRSLDGRESLVALMESGRPVRRDAAVRRGAPVRRRPGPWSSPRCSASRTARCRRPSTPSPSCSGSVVGLLAERLRVDRLGPGRRGVPRCDRAGRPSGCWSWRATQRSSSCRSPRRSWPAWSAPPGSGSTRRSPRSSAWAGSSRPTAATASSSASAWSSGPAEPPARRSGRLSSCSGRGCWTRPVGPGRP